MRYSASPSLTDFEVSLTTLTFATVLPVVKP
jgi:hypothetical protein